MATRIQRILALSSKERLAEIDKRTENEMAPISRSRECVPFSIYNTSFNAPFPNSGVGSVEIFNDHVEIHPATSETIFVTVPLMETVGSLNSVADINISASGIPKIALSSTNSANMTASQNVLPREVVQLSRPKKDEKGKYLTKIDISDTYDASLTNQIRTCTRRYTVAGVQVCKKNFTPTLKISRGRINGYLKKTQKCQIIDNKGKASVVKRLIISHIKRFPRYKSHCCRAQTSNDFLLHHKNEYSEPVSLSSYKKIFYSKFNLLCKPLKDACNVCDALNTQLKDHDVPGLRQKLEVHQEAAEMARTEMKNDMKCATKSTVLALYNYGIHDGSSEKGYCYIWVEGQAGRGAQEVFSCLQKHLMERLPEGKKHVILWSVSNGGQNRNIKLVLMLKAVLASHPTLETVAMKFLIPGHSFLPNIMRFCCNKNKLTVTEMRNGDFVGSACLEKKITNRKKDIEGKGVNWLKTINIEFDKRKTYSLVLKISFNSVGQEICLKRRNLSRVGSQDDVSGDNLQPL
ncbi:hypothetical protein PR048_006928 [Dryococelus australis]|uniref:Uncharacterized protein n=1 Tax=Dryococelus australis TaxID=614101 RepID=A0ABQ9IDI9_9NEOP|nr:hypothetical protein PR048_006928 [Dryococelus australis]